MIVDTSAVIALLRGEPEAAAVAEALAGAPTARLSAGTYLEASIIVDAVGDAVLSRRFDDLVATVPLIVEPFDADHAAVARQAYRDYGKGSGHPARLNLGDCFAYALARTTREPLLYKGDDFGHTDLTAALG